jgi:alpha-ketoglutarate-dependent taurine dioxygenase
METHPPSAIIEWRRDRLLVVDNARLLHRRPAVDGLAERLIERTYVWDD